MAPANNFFTHWVKEINVTKYDTNKQSTPQEIYQYSDAMLKHLPEKYLKKLRRHFLFSEKEVIYMLVWIEDQIMIIDDRIAKFSDQIKNKFTFRIPLRYLCDIGKINFPTKIDMKIRLALETDLKKLFETKKNVAAIGTRDAQIVLLKAPYLQYEQIVLAKNFRQYLESILCSAGAEDGRAKNTLPKNVQAAGRHSGFHCGFYRSE